MNIYKKGIRSSVCVYACVYVCVCVRGRERERERERERGTIMRFTETERKEGYKNNEGKTNEPVNVL